MVNDKKIVVGTFAILFLLMVVFYKVNSQAFAVETTVEVPEIQNIQTGETQKPIVEDSLLKSAKEDGYTDSTKWTKDLAKSKKNNKKWITKQYKKYKKYLSKKQKKKILKYKSKIQKAKYIKQIKKYKKKVLKILRPAKKKKSFDDKSNHRVTITRSGGVYNYNGWHETYYSSRVLYHHMTSKWICDKEGFWRTKEGYYVVATDARSYGSIVHGSKGLCKVLDGGCGSNLDYYVNW